MVNNVVILLIISIIWVYGLDISGFGYNLRKWLWKILLKPRGSVEDIPAKPFFCSLCMTWWSGLIYLIIVGGLNPLNIVALIAVSYLTDIIASTMRFIHDLLAKIIDLLYQWLKL